MHKLILGLALASLSLLPQQPAHAEQPTQADGTATSVCVVGGCYVWTCTQAGCGWVWTPTNPFDNGTKKTN